MPNITGYNAWSVTAGEQPTTAMWNILGSNDAAFNTALTGTGTISSVILTNPYKFKVYRAAAQSLSSGAWSKVQPDTKVFDTSSNFDNTTNYRFVAPIAGFYQFNAQAGVNAFPGATLTAVALYKNATQEATGDQGDSGGSASTVLAVSDLIQLAANDYVEMWVFNGAGVSESLNVGGSTAANNFTGHLVSAT